MRRLLLYIIGTVVLLSACMRSSDISTDEPFSTMCSFDEAAGPAPTIVTVKQDAAGAVFFQLDDSTRVYPVNYTLPYKGLQRIICRLSLNKEQSQCYIHWMDGIERGDVTTQNATSSPMPDSQSAGLDVIDDWMTGVEDGFLTVHYSAWWGEGKVSHTLCLYQSPGEENTFEFTLLHNANGDKALKLGDALVYFDIDPLLPPTQGGYKTLTLKWTTLEGKTAAKEFKYRSRQ